MQPSPVAAASANVAVVGFGSPASCSEEALGQALASHAVITFDCGEAPVTIVITRTIEVPAERVTVIDGSNRITLDGRHAVRILSVAAEGYRSNRSGLTLRRLRLSNGRAAGESPVARDKGHPRCAYGFSGGSGGAVLVRNATLRIVDVTFSGNTAASPGPDVAGGAIYAAGSVSVEVLDSRFSNNTASNGGAIGLLQSDATISRSRFDANAATGTGRNHADADVSGCPGVGHAGQGGAGGNGGAVMVDGSDNETLVIRESVFTHNRANELAGAVFRTSNGTGRPTTITHSSFEKNSAAQAGALFVMNGSRVELTRSNFIGNRALAAGAVHIAESSVTISGSVFAENQSNGGPGAAVLLSRARPASTVEDSTFSRNAAQGSRRDIETDTTIAVKSSWRCVDKPEGVQAEPHSETRIRSNRCRVMPITDLGAQ